MNLEENNIYDIAKDAAEENNFFIVDFVFRGNPKERIIEIFIDGIKNVSAEDLANLSRIINSRIEEKNLIVSKYRLDVSSPGTDRPLKFLNQYPKHINRKFELSYSAGDETKKLAGKLIRIEEDILVFLSNQNEISINFNNIKKTKVIVSFS
jgi:ribosome maturation factor RimP